MRPIVLNLGPFALASAANVLTSTSVTTGAVTLNGSLVSSGVATLDVARRLLFTSSGNDVGLYFSIAGTDGANNTIGETLSAVSATTYRTALDYKTVTGVTASGASAGTVTIGTANSGGVASFPWVRMDEWALPQIALMAAVSGVVSYTIRSTLDDPNDLTNPVAAANVAWVNSSDANVVNATSTQQSNYNFAPRYIQCLINSYTGVTASVRLTVTQSGVVPL